jgi:hypothetical protein
MSATHWSIAIYGGNGTPLTSPSYSSENEARRAFNSPDVFDPEALPESYAAVLWEMKDSGQASAVLSKVVSAPVSEPDTWSPGF